MKCTVQAHRRCAHVGQGKRPLASVAASAGQNARSRRTRQLSSDHTPRDQPGLEAEVGDGARSAASQRSITEPHGAVQTARKFAAGQENAGMRAAAGAVPSETQGLRQQQQPDSGGAQEDEALAAGDASGGASGTDQLQQLMPSTAILQKLYPWLFHQGCTEMTVEYARLVSSA